MMKERLWAITDHVCRKCGGRVLCCVHGNGMTPGSNRIHRCADCGASGYSAGDVCWCGFTHRGQNLTPYRCVPWSATKERPELIRALKACGFDESRQEVGIVLVKSKEDQP